MTHVTARLDTGDSFPVLSVDTLGHGVVSVPSDFAGRYAVLLFYRAHW